MILILGSFHSIILRFFMFQKVNWIIYFIGRIILFEILDEIKY